MEHKRASKYENGKIYKICSDDPNITDMYIGSTIQDLYARFRGHTGAFINNKSDYASRIMFQKYGVDPFHIELLECYPCQSKKELERIEGKYQLENKCVNYRIAGRTEKEWRTFHKERLKAVSKLYRETNHDTIVVKKAQYYADNREEIRAKENERCKNNRQAVRNRQNTLILCECGKNTTYSNLSRHIKTKKHATLMEALQQQAQACP